MNILGMNVQENVCFTLLRDIIQGHVLYSGDSKLICFWNINKSYTYRNLTLNVFEDLYRT